MQMSSEQAIRYLCLYIIDMMDRFKFNTIEYKYPACVIENAFLRCIEQSNIFENRTGYVIIIGSEGMEFVSGNNPSLATSWNGSRPNISYLSVGDIKNVLPLHLRMMKAAVNGGFVRYMWIDPKNLTRKEEPRTAYIKEYDDYLRVAVSYNPDIVGLGDTSIPATMCDFLQQFISNFVITNAHREKWDDRFLDSIDDGNTTLIDGDEVIIGRASETDIQRANAIVDLNGGGYIDDNTFCSQVAFTNMIVWYRYPS